MKGEVCFKGMRQYRPLYTTHKFSFQSHRLLFSHASAEVRGENTPERKVASTRDRTHNHQVISPTCSPLSHPGGDCQREPMKEISSLKKKKLIMTNKPDEQNKGLTISGTN